MPFTRMLVPTDFSDPAHHALRCAIEEARLHRASVTLLHVVPPSAGTDVYYVTGAPAAGPQAGYDPVVGGRLGAPMPPPPTVVRRDYNEEALTRLRDLIPDDSRDTWAVEIAIGHPAETIVRMAEERQADLIVMGTHGRTGLQHVLLGSVAEKVVRLAPCPVLTVRIRGEGAGG
jgi:nucleotide-binding universal stress UspA family protein